MLSKTTDSCPKLRKQHEEPANDDVGTLVNKISQLKKQIQVERIVSIKDKVQRNWEKLQSQVSEVKSAISSRDSLQTEKKRPNHKLSARIDHPLYKFSGLSKGSRNIDHVNHVSAARINIPFMEKLPPYTSWIHLARNERMTEDQSVIGRRRIYYDQQGHETLRCSDSEEELTEPGELKHDFSEGEDRLLLMTFEEHGLTEEVLNIVSQCVGGTTSEIQERYKNLKEKNMGRMGQHFEDSGGYESHTGICLEKSLSDALDSLDNLFCRRCILFDCPMHGCSQPSIYPRESLSAWFEPEGDRKPCSDQCYLWVDKGRHCELDKRVVDGQKDATNETKCMHLSNSMEGQVDEMLNLSTWKPLEKELYLKGVEMFGRNSCLIARNLLSGLKTCMEIANYMHAGEVSMSYRSIAASSSTIDENGKIDPECTGQEMPLWSQLRRKRGKTRKFRYSWKSAGLPSIWRRIADGKNQSLKQYTPCECRGTCGKQCPCHENGNCCEKYCGCSKFCKNRFRGCHCVKSQCRTRQCPCFASRRECDPDVCRNCWVSCGDGSLGEPPRPRCGDGQCGNMRFLLRQQQRILLAKSDVAGWGAFLKNPVNKDDYLGEYTGELISQSEADMRGQLYDRANSSFLFNLNDQYVLDACRKGDKLKFANHSSNSNCYAKVVMVAGDHRVGIFAKEHIEAGQELFYDYCYGPDQAPPWARKPEDSKRDESAGSQGRARKQQSH